MLWQRWENKQYAISAHTSCSNIISISSSSSSEYSKLLFHEPFFSCCLHFRLVCWKREKRSTLFNLPAAKLGPDMFFELLLCLGALFTAAVVVSLALCSVRWEAVQPGSGSTAENDNVPALPPLQLLGTLALLSISSAFLCNSLSSPVEDLSRR